MIFIQISCIPHGHTTQEAPLGAIMTVCGPLMTGECAMIQHNPTTLNGIFCNLEQIDNLMVLYHHHISNCFLRHLHSFLLRPNPSPLPFVCLISFSLAVCCSFQHNGVTLSKKNIAICTFSFLA